jgi:mannose-6-phosphate isomerase-like protein (cupin superfamily)
MTVARKVLGITAALIVVPAFAADPVGFGLWKSGELRKRETALATKVGPDHSARETLAAYDNHRLRMLYRDADGVPEQHDGEIDVVIVENGEATLVLGGQMTEIRAGAGPGEYLGTSIEGGERHELSAGDLVHIPPRTPHRFLVAEGKDFTYVIVKLPAR